MKQNIISLNPNPPDALIYKKLAQEVACFVKKHDLTPPLTLDELTTLTDLLLKKKQELSLWRDWIMVMINNEVWNEIVATVPFNRRILLLPQCLRHSDSCKAPIDEYGLLCQGCGLCTIHDLQREAEDLGMMCLIAEGSTLVADLLESGSVDAVIGVSCLGALEKSFPYMVKNAVPGLAFPLYSDGCKDTATDIDLVRKAFKKSAGDFIPQVNLKTISQQVNRWFLPEKLEDLLGVSQSKTDTLAREWLIKGGHRFRPFLVTAVAHSLGIQDFKSDINLQKLAIALECFHKASLIHDDIEDDDSTRYESPTLHKKWGIPIALNIGDFLLGEGYRLIGELNISSDKKTKLLQATSDCHLRLCQGQGEELLAQKEKTSKPLKEVLDILRNKTAPAFEAALLYGLIYSDGDDNLHKLFQSYSENLGIAYQIRDDLEDDDTGDQTQASSFSIINAIKDDPSMKAFSPQHKAWELYEQYQRQTLRVLQPIKNSHLKKLFFQITMRILYNVPEPTKPFSGNI